MKHGPSSKNRIGIQIGGGANSCMDGGSAGPAGPAGPVGPVGVFWVSDEPLFFCERDINMPIAKIHMMIATITDVTINIIALYSA